MEITGIESLEMGIVLLINIGIYLLKHWNISVKLMNKDLWRWVFQCLKSDSVTYSALFSVNFSTLDVMSSTEKKKWVSEWLKN